MVCCLLNIKRDRQVLTPLNTTTRSQISRCCSLQIPKCWTACFVLGPQAYSIIWKAVENSMATDVGRIVLPDPEQLRRTPPVCGPAHAKHSCVVSIPGVCPRMQGECIPCSVEQTTTRLSMEMHPPVEPEKTKRQFAHRTKTGCRTCRRRKKKCDEAKPWCNNCRRGNFVCDGYTEEVPTPGSLTTARG
jgi:hypothetical protein